MNVDASVGMNSSSFSVGMVHAGTFLRGKTMRFGRMVSVYKADAIGINEALSWIMTANSEYRH